MAITTMNKLSFSGHESFICKQFWLKKVYDFANGKTKFNDETAVVDLGVGKNMVSSLRFWGKAFGVLDDSDMATSVAEYIFGNKGNDIYLEDYGTLWILHYLLVKTGRASIYNLVFNEFRKERVDFTKNQLHVFIKRKCEEVGKGSYNANTVNSDINVFIRNYLKPQVGDKFEIEDDFSGIMIDLDLIKHYKQRIDNNTVHWYKIEAQDRIDLPFQIVLYSILDNYEGQSSVTFKELQIGHNSPGMVFALNAEGLYTKLQQIQQRYPEINYSETAGNQVLQITKPIQPKKILDDYYQN